MNDVSDFAQQYQNHAKALAEANLLNKTTVFDALIGLRISKVTVTFDGEGDSGQIEEVVAFVDEKSQRIPEATIRFRDATWGREEGKVSEVSLYEGIKGLCYDYPSQEHGGWENNDGGYGDFTFDVAERLIVLDFNQRFSDSTCYHHAF
jgi:hypothetical protein